MHCKPLLCLANLYFQSYPAEMGQNLKDPDLFMQNSTSVEAPELGAMSIFKMWVMSRDSCIPRLTMEGNYIPKFVRFLQTGYNSLHKFSCKEFGTNCLELHLQIPASLWVSESHFKIQKPGDWPLLWSILHSFSSESGKIPLLQFGVAFLNQAYASKITTAGTSILHCSFYLEIM